MLISPVAKPRKLLSGRSENMVPPNLIMVYHHMYPYVPLKWLFDGIPVYIYPKFSDKSICLYAIWIAECSDWPDCRAWESQLSKKSSCLGICQTRIINWSWPEYQNISSQPMRDCQRHLTYSKMMMRFESHELVSEYDVEFLKRSFWMRLSFWIRHHLCVAIAT